MSRDCARTPEGPWKSWSPPSSGRYLWSRLTNAGLKASRHISVRPVFRYRPTSRRKPGYESVSTRSGSETVRILYPSRANARTAFGPASTFPSIRLLKWTPRKGKAGSGTGLTSARTRCRASGLKV